MNLGSIAQLLSDGSVQQGLQAPLDEVEPRGYSIDSRTIRAGDLFFAIRGENNDGHRFLADVFGKGAVAAVVEKTTTAPLEAGPDGVAIESRLIRVNDTLEALQALASGVIKSWRGCEVAI